MRCCEYGPRGLLYKTLCCLLHPSHMFFKTEFYKTFFNARLQSNIWILALPAKIRLGLKQMEVANTLAYYDYSLKKFCTGH